MIYGRCYKYLICLLAAVIITANVAAIGYFGKDQKSDFQKTGRAIVKFCPRASADDKIVFFNKFGLKPVASDIFGYDVAEWSSAPPDLKSEKSPFGCAVAGSKQKIVIEDYEIEDARITAPPFKKSLPLSKQGCLSDQRMAYWLERFIKAEAAHWFLRAKGIPLWPNGIVVADEGFDLEHPDIKPVLKYENEKPIYWINPTAKIAEQADDHATLVSCLAAGYRNGKGIDGVAALDSYVLPLMLSFESGKGSFFSDVAIGLAHFYQLEKQGKIAFSVVNMSFHMTLNSRIVYAAIKQLSDKVFVVAAGNSGYSGIQVDLDEKKQYPASWKLPNIIVVAATDDKNLLAHFSNFGKKNVDLAAPGKSVCSCRKGGVYEAHDGTSFSTPLVAGAVSLLFSIDPFMRPESAKQALLLGADEVPFLDSWVRAGKRLNVYNSARLIYYLNYEFRQ